MGSPRGAPGKTNIGLGCRLSAAAVYTKPTSLVYSHTSQTQPAPFSAQAQTPDYSRNERHTLCAGIAAQGSGLSAGDSGSVLLGLHKGPGWHRAASERRCGRCSLCSSLEGSGKTRRCKSRGEEEKFTVRSIPQFCWSTSLDSEQ